LYIRKYTYLVHVYIEFYLMSGHFILTFIKHEYAYLANLCQA